MDDALRIATLREANILIPQRTKQHLERALARSVDWDNPNVLAVHRDIVRVLSQTTRLGDLAAAKASADLYDALRRAAGAEGDFQASRFANRDVDFNQLVAHMMARHQSEAGLISALGDWMDARLHNHQARVTIDNARRDPASGGIRLIVHGDMEVCHRKNVLHFQCDDIAARWERNQAEGHRPSGGLHPNCMCEVVPVAFSGNLPPILSEWAARNRARQQAARLETLPLLKDSPIMAVRDGTDLEAIRRLTNPNYPKPGYATNCQRVVHAYELRRRGVDVMAGPNDSPWPGWQDVLVNPKDPTDTLASRFTASRKNVADLPNQDPEAWVRGEMASWPPGSRGYVWFDRAGGAGHVFNVYVDANGNIVVAEAQNPSAKDVTLGNHLTETPPITWVRVAQVNDLDFTDDVMKAIE